MTLKGKNGLPIQPKGTKEIELPSGAIAVIEKFKGKHVKEAMKSADPNNPNDMVFALIAQLTTINGSPVVKEDLDEMDGADVMQLMNEFSGDNFRNS